MDIINTDSFSSHVKALLEEWHTPGLCIAAFDKDSSVTAAFGFASVDPPIPTTPNTIFDMASSSKALTAAAVGKLVSDETFEPRIDWDTPVSKLLPEEFVMSDNYATDNVTVEDVLSHRSGLPRHDDSFLNSTAKIPDTSESVTRNLRNLPLSAPLRTKWQYCNLMYTVASFLVEKLSHQAFADFLQSNIFDVLGMSSSYLQPRAVIAAGQGHRLATRHIWNKDLQKYVALEPKNEPEAQGAGSIQSTVGDYAKWVQAMMSKDPRLFPAEIYEELVKPRIICQPQDDANLRRPFTSPELYCLGWSIRSYRGHDIIEHDGLINGVTSLMMYMPSLNLGLVMCANGNDGESVTYTLAMEIIDQVLGIPIADRIPWAERERQKMEEAAAEEPSLEDVQRKICPDGAQVLTTPLERYTGTFKNAGYHEITIDVQNQELHIDGSDRSEPFQMFLSHVCEDKKFIATINEVTGEVLRWNAEFRFSDAGDVVLAVGIAFCEEMDGELIWFDRV